MKNSSFRTVILSTCRCQFRPTFLLPAFCSLLPCAEPHTEDITTFSFIAAQNATYVQEIVTWSRTSESQLLALVFCSLFPEAF